MYLWGVGVMWRGAGSGIGGLCGGVFRGWGICVVVLLRLCGSVCFCCLVFVRLGCWVAARSCGWMACWLNGWVDGWLAN